MNYPNNIYNQNIFVAQGMQNQGNVIPIPYRNGGNILPKELGNNINDFKANRTTQGFYPNMNMAFYQGQNIIYDKKYSKETKPISRNTNALGRINYEAKTDPIYNNANYHKRRINNNYLKYVQNPNSNIIDEDSRGRPIYYEYIPSKLKMKNVVIKKDYDELKKKIVKEIITPKQNKTYDDFQEMVVNYGYLNKKVIEEEVKKNPENFVKVKEAVKQKDSNERIFILGKLGESLESMGINVVIDKRDNANSKEYIINNQFISSGIIKNYKYEFNINENDQMKIYKILNDENTKKKFIDDWRETLSKYVQLSKDQIYITNLRNVPLKMDVIYKRTKLKDVNGAEIKLDDKMMEFANTHPEIISIFKKNILEACKLTLNMLDNRGNRKPDEWPKNGVRGGMEYFPPDNTWVGYGLRVLDEYENNDWIAMNGNPNEWAVAYHGTSQGAVKPICSRKGKFFSTIAEGATGQKCKDCENINPKSKLKYQKCEEGAYCSPHLYYACKYANITNNGVIIMCRVNPSLIRIPKGQFQNDEWITDGTKNSIRPYRLLYKINS
jgi:hypothetical protein